MATDATSLLAEAACYQCGQWPLLKLGLLKLWLLALDPDADTSPNALLEDAKCYICFPPDTLRLLSLGLLTQMVTGVVPPEPETPTTPVLVLNGSSPSSILVQFTQETEPETTEVWKSINGGAYALAATIDGALTEYADVAGIPSGAVWCYKVRGVNGDLDGEFSNIGCAVRDMLFPGVGAVSFPTWMLALGDYLVSDDGTLVTSLDLSGLLYVETDFAIDSTLVLASLNLAKLAVVGGELTFASSGLTGPISLPALATVGGDLTFTFAKMSSISLPVLTAVGGNIECDSCDNLVTVSMPLFVFVNGHDYHFDNCKLNAATVAHILRRAVLSGVVSATITLNNGTNAGLASLSAQGQADYAALVLAGNTMDINA
jgi:hypothetical protein